jgi:NAD(P)-dependent dehydrogenase (short-subunit alcohol dehydrogenase family)
MQDLDGKLALVTGAASGIGRGIALALSGAGMQVAVIDRDGDGAAQTCEHVAAAGGRARAFVADVAVAGALDALAEQVERELGPVSVLCNNAGVAVGGALLDASDADWRWLLDVNVLGVVRGCRAFAPRMVARGEPAQIVNTASIGGFLSGGDLGVYCTTKYAIVGYSESLRAELAPHGIGVSVLCPGAYRTRLADAARGRAAGYGTGQAEVGALRFLAGAGDDPDGIGVHVLRGIREDAPYIFTHAAFRPLLEGRFASVLAEVDRAGTTG